MEENNSQLHSTNINPNEKIIRMKPQLTTDEKYRLYQEAVQDPEYDVELFDTLYAEYFPGKIARTIREDFCGSFFLSNEWVQDDPKKVAYAYDISDEALAWGQKNHFEKLSSEAQSRLRIKKENVLNAEKLHYDIVVASNFSYFIFKKREELKCYFSSVYESMEGSGLFVLDHFGGPDNFFPNLEEKDVELDDGREFTYQWELESFNPVNHHGKFAIHFKNDETELLYKRVFEYDWRLWMLSELIELLEEVGFKKVRSYWEDDDGEFVYLPEGEGDLDSWVVQIVAMKSD